MRNRFKLFEALYRGEVSRMLINLWLLNHPDKKVNTQDTSLFDCEMKRHERWLISWTLRVVGYLCVLFAVWNLPTDIGAKIFFSAIALIALVGISPWRTDKIDRDYGHADQFIKDWHEFYHEIRISTDYKMADIAALSKDELYQLCHRNLTIRTIDRLDLEDSDPDKARAESDEWKRSFCKAHSIFLRFGLAQQDDGGIFRHYFDAARADRAAGEVDA